MNDNLLQGSVAALASTASLETLSIARCGFDCGLTSLVLRRAGTLTEVDARGNQFEFTRVAAARRVAEESGMDLRC